MTCKTKTLMVGVIEVNISACSTPIICFQIRSTFAAISQPCGAATVGHEFVRLCAPLWKFFECPYN